MKLFRLYDPAPSQRLLLHVLFWSVFFLARLYFTFITFNVYAQFPLHITVLLTLCNTLVLAVVYYWMVIFLWPLVSGRKYFRSLFYLLLVVAAYTIVDALIERTIVRDCMDCMSTLQASQPGYYALIRSDLLSVFLKRFVTLGTPASLILLLSIPLCIKLGLTGWRQQTRALQLAKDNLELEFNFLKAQLNPHFLFNSMNNIYGLILSGKQDKSAGMVTRLSDMLRYLLYESNEQYMPLDREIRLINDYTELEKIRLNETAVRFSAVIDHPHYRVAPLLFMPLLENAFKFCADEPGSQISIVLETKNDLLHFSIGNSITPVESATLTGGIGLTNLQKRLKLYYPGRHTYKVTADESTYTATIEIRLI